MKKSLLAITLILSPLLYGNAFGCSCPTIGTTPEQAKVERLKDFERAATIFTGEVVELEENRVKFKVERIWKGELVDEIVMVIQFKNDDGRYIRTSCDNHYKLGEKLLVYAYGTAEELTTYQCSRTTRFKNTQRLEEEIKGLDEIKSLELRENRPK